MRYLVFFLIVISCISCNGQSNDNQRITKPAENIKPTEEQSKRRQASEDYCNAHKIPFYKPKSSLYVDDDNNIQIRSKDSVVDRVLAICYVALKSENPGKEFLDKFSKKFNIEPKLSVKEKAFANAESPTDQQNIDAGWKYEDLHVLLWALGYIDSLSYPDKMCDVPADLKIIANLTEQQFRAKAKLRSKKEIIDQADLILRIDWACVDARVNQKTTPGDLNASVVVERHYALNWLINFSDESWDDVTTDT